MSAGFYRKYHMAPECSKALRLAHGGRPMFQVSNLVFIKLLTLFDSFHLIMTHFKPCIQQVFHIF